MNKSTFNHDVTYIALENFVQRSFEIAFEVFHKLQESDDVFVKEFVLVVGQEELYESLMYHKEIINSIFVTKNYQLIEEFFVWKYSVYQSRGIDVDCFLVEYDLWQHSISNHLYQSHSSEISMIYDYLIFMHEHFKTLALSPKKVLVDENYKDVFDALCLSLLGGQKEEFYMIIEKNLPIFNDDIFKFIEEIIDPLMYEIGHMWQYNKLSVAKEHLATQLTSEIIDMFFVKVNKSHEKRPRAIVSTVGDESHNLGVKIVGRFLDSCGFDVNNLGSKISNNELLSSVYELKPDVLVLSVTLASNIATLQKIVDELKSDENIFKGLVIVGGQALFSGEKKISIFGADFCSKNLDDLKNFLTMAIPPVVDLG
jgi:MerR family transcriptional regulator, light-induced transcriptional regulator